MLGPAGEMNAIPGEAGVDYPVYNTGRIMNHGSVYHDIRPSWFPVPDTGFDCADQTVPGFYTDPAADCQVFEEISNSTWIWLFSTYFQSFYMCTPGGDEASFLCPNGTSNDLILLKIYDDIGFPFNRCYY